MSFFDGFPFTNMHELNLDWMIGKFKEMAKKVDNIPDLVTSESDNIKNAVVVEIQEQLDAEISGFEQNGNAAVEDFNTDSLEAIKNFNARADKVLEDVQTQSAPFPWYLEDKVSRGCFYRLVDGEREWLNPPMFQNAAYRTTEKIEGVPVYCALVYKASLRLESETTKTVAHGIPDFGSLVRINASHGGNPLPICTTAGGIAGVSAVDNTYIHVASSYVDGSAPFLAVLYYLKAASKSS